MVIPMKGISQLDRREFWKYQGALLTLAQVSALCDRLSPLPPNDPQFYPLMIALHALYARPFRHSKDNRNLEEGLIPSQHSELHKTLLRSRDKVFAHQDKSSGFADETGQDLCKLRVHVRNRAVDFSLSYLFPTETRLVQVQALCSALSRKCKYRSEKIWKKATGNRQIPEGTYEVDFQSEKDEPLLRESAI